MAFTAFWILNTQESLFIYPMRRPDLDRLISCYTPILVGRFIFHLFNKAVDFAGAHLTEGPSFNFCFCKSKALSPFLVAITQVTYNFLDLCLLIHFWLLGFFFSFLFSSSTMHAVSYFTHYNWLCNRGFFGLSRLPYYISPMDVYTPRTHLLTSKNLFLPRR